jgi:hypothetical protein
MSHIVELLLLFGFFSGFIIFFELENKHQPLKVMTKSPRWCIIQWEQVYEAMSTTTSPSNLKNKIKNQR